MCSIQKHLILKKKKKKIESVNVNSFWFYDDVTHTNCYYTYVIIFTKMMYCELCNFQAVRKTHSLKFIESTNVAKLYLFIYF